MELVVALLVLLVFGALCIGAVVGISYAIVKATKNGAARAVGGFYSGGNHSSTHHWTGDSGSAPWDHGDTGSSGSSSCGGGGSSCGGGGSSCGGGGSSCGGGSSS